ncbi:MAG: hypothetical protein QMC67_13210 [Candidatus Wallbacteria bacterium]
MKNYIHGLKLLINGSYRIIKVITSVKDSRNKGNVNEAVKGTKEIWNGFKSIVRINKL